jgi:hypothetical protein
MGGMKLGRALFKSALTALSQDKKIIWAPVLGGLATMGIGIIVGVVAFFAILFTPSDYSEVIGVAFAIVFGIFAAFVHVFTQATVMSAANQRYDGFAPTIGSGLSQANTRFGNLSKFALLEATVGFVLRLVRENLQAIGNFISFAGGLAWAVSSYFAMPVILFEGLGPIASIKRSVAIIKEKWGSALRLNLAAGVAFLLVWLAAFGVLFAGIAGLTSANTGNATLDQAVLFSSLSGIAGSLVLLIAIAFVQQTVMSYACVALYRYAVGKPVPGFDPALMERAFRLKKQKFTGLAGA